MTPPLADPGALTARASAAAGHWGRLALPPRLVSHRENAVFEVQFTDGTHAALRLHRPGYQSLAGIRSELAWCRALAATGFPCPAPLALPSGALCLDLGPQAASLVRWLDAPPLADPGPRMAEIGALAARLHAATDTLTPPRGFSRPRWDAEGLLGAAPHWGRFWDSPALTAGQAAELSAFRDAAHAALLSMEAPDTGPIHADMLRENILGGPDGLILIDFDDCGIGPRGYDLGSALSQSVPEPDLPARARALLHGYARHRDPGPEPERRLTLFTALRCCASVGWLMTRRTPDDPATRGYVDRALAIARLWLNGESITADR